MKKLSLLFVFLLFGGSLLLTHGAVGAPAPAAASDARLLEVLEQISERLAQPAAPTAKSPPPPPSSSLEDILIPIVAMSIPIAFFILIFAIVAIDAKRKVKEKEANLALVKAFTESGQPVPPEVLSMQRGKNPILSGSILIAIGAGLLIYSITNAPNLIGLTLIPLLVGVAFLLQGIILRK